MIKYVMIIMMYSFGHDGGVATTTQVFEDKQSCEIAALWVRNRDTIDNKRVVVDCFPDTGPSKP